MPQVPSDKLTPQQRVFVENYVIHFNGTRACREAGYHPRYAAELMRNSKIKQAIEDHLDAYSQAKKALKDRIIQELCCIGFSNLDDVGRFGPSGLELREHEDIPFNTKRAIAEYTVSENDRGVNAKLKFHNKTHALELLGKHLGMFNEKPEVQVNVEPYIIKKRNGDEIELGTRLAEKKE